MITKQALCCSSTYCRGPACRYRCTGKFNPNENRWEELDNSPHKGFRGLWPMRWPELGGGGGYDLELDQDELFNRMVGQRAIRY